MNDPLIDWYWLSKDYYTELETGERALMFGFDFQYFPGNIKYETKRNNYRERHGFHRNVGKEYNRFHLVFVLFYTTYVINVRLNCVGEVK